jgi:hypothetical protein
LSFVVEVEPFFSGSTFAVGDDEGVAVEEEEAEEDEEA